jgi:hypoxanthine phosphoribosyltransferase
MLPISLIGTLRCPQSYSKQAAERARRAHRRAPDASPDGRAVLIVDDHRDGAESLAAVLRLFGRA